MFITGILKAYLKHTNNTEIVFFTVSHEQPVDDEEWTSVSHVIRPDHTFVDVINGHFLGSDTIVVPNPSPEYAVTWEPYLVTV
jgi:hypothetical protein